MADGVTTDPLLFDWRRVHQPIGYDEDQHAALAACMEAAGMRNIWFSYIDRSVQTRRHILSQIRSSFAQARSEGAASTNDETARDPAIDGLAHLWKGYLAHGRRALAGLDGRRVILAPELGGGYGIADFVIGRCLVEVKAAFDPVPSIGDWLNQVLAYALLDWSDALGIDAVAVYLGWQALLVSDSLARVLAAATPGSTPSLDSLRADFRTAMQVDIDESFATRMRQRHPVRGRPTSPRSHPLSVRAVLIRGHRVVEEPRLRRDHSLANHWHEPLQQFICRSGAAGARPPRR